MDTIIQLKGTLMKKALPEPMGTMVKLRSVLSSLFTDGLKLAAHPQEKLQRLGAEEGRGISRFSPTAPGGAIPAPQARHQASTACLFHEPCPLLTQPLAQTLWGPE